MTAPRTLDAPERTDPRVAERQRELLRLRLDAPKRGRQEGQGLAGCPLFDPGLGL